MTKRTWRPDTLTYAISELLDIRRSVVISANNRNDMFQVTQQAALNERTDGATEGDTKDPGVIAVRI